MNPELSYEVNDLDFETAVLDRSLDVPVLLDCWAPWCGPCKSLTPVLEKLVQEYRGRFVLAKVNVDESPQVASALRARSIPLVTLLKGGQPVAQFSGALPESQVRAFLDQHLDPAPPEEETVEEPDPFDEIDQLIAEGHLDTARRLLEQIPTELHDDRYHAIQARLKLASERPPGDKKALEVRIAANAKDFEARFGLAALLAYEGDFNAAFDQLLEVVLRDKGEQREKARLQLVEWFGLCPDPEIVSRGRRYLGMYLN